MPDVIIEVDDAEPDVAALRGAMPELFDAATIVEPAIALLVGPRERAVEDLAAVEKIAPEAGWSAADVGELRAEVERAKDGVAGAIVPAFREAARGQQEAVLP